MFSERWEPWIRRDWGTPSCMHGASAITSCDMYSREYNGLVKPMSSLCQREQCGSRPRGRRKKKNNYRSSTLSMATQLSHESGQKVFRGNNVWSMVSFKKMFDFFRFLLFHQIDGCCSTVSILAFNILNIFVVLRIHTG